jgi:hypothetical protein
VTVLAKKQNYHDQLCTVITEFGSGMRESVAPSMMRTAFLRPLNAVHSGGGFSIFGAGLDGEVQDLAQKHVQ